MKASLFGPAALTAGWLVTVAGALSAQNPDCAAGAVRYVEWAERGPLAQSGRPLPALQATEYGVDINSRIQIAVDTACLIAYLDRQAAGPAPSARSRALRSRVDSLVAILGAVPTAIEQLQQTFDAYARGGAEAGPVFQERLQTSSTTIRRILRALQAAIQARLEAGDSTRADASRAAKADFDAVLSGGGALPYDWPVLRALINREIELTRADLDQFHRTAGYALELRAHLLSGKGQYPVGLAGYNDETPCAETRVEPIELEISPEQAQLFQQAESLEHRIGAVRGVGNVVVGSVSADLDRIRPELDTLAGRAARAAAPVAAAGRSLVRWTRGDTLRLWTEGLSTALSRDPKGAAVKATLDSLADGLAQANADLDALRSFGSLKDQLAGVSAQTAMQAILARVEQIRRLTNDDAAPIRALQPATWVARAALVKRLAVQLGQLPPQLRDRIRSDPRGPVRDLETLGRALQQAADSLAGVSQDALGLLGRVLGLPPALLAANLPEPAGVRRRAVGAGLGTEIELTRICAARRENDVVQVEYRFFAGEQPIGGWTDRFRLRVFGLRSRVGAGLAFAIRQHTDTWRPGAAVSWIFTHRNWPRGPNRGLGDAAGLGQLGLGLTAVNLHFESDEAIELGIGPSLTFLGDRIVVGGGWNLQAHGNHLYGLLSIRLLDLARGT